MFLPLEVQDVVWMAQMNCLDLHPWNARADDMDHADELRIDLDPTPEYGFEAVIDVAHTVREILGQVPLFGICLGHQMLARALGLPTEKLPFGHRGANHPVRRHEDDRVEITVQNHGYAVREAGLPDGVEVSRTSLFDGSVEGLSAPELRAFSVQYHPEARPGPRDARYLFREFIGGLA